MHKKNKREKLEKWYKLDEKRESLKYGSPVFIGPSFDIAINMH